MSLTIHTAARTIHTPERATPVRASERATPVRAPERATPVRAPERATPVPVGHRRITAGSAARTAVPTAPVTPRPSHRTSPARFAALLVRAMAEVLAGQRPYRQIEPFLAPGLTRRLVVALRDPRPRPSGDLRVRRVVAAPPTPNGGIEATVVIERAGRVSAVAVRLERHHGLWRATELTAPEAGYAPLATASAGGGRRRDAFGETASRVAQVSRG